MEFLGDIEELFTGLPTSPLFITGHYEYNFLYFLVICFFFFVLSTFIKDKKQQAGFLFIVLGIFAFKASFILFNETYSIFQRKAAGNFSLWFYVILKEQGFEGLKALPIGKTFYPQLFMNYPVFEMFGASRINLILTNSLVASLGPILVFFYSYKNYNVYSAFTTLIVLTVFPAAVNFSFFGLRDPLLYFCIILNLISFFQFFKRITLWSICGILLSSYIVFVSRPELIAFLGFPFFLWFFLLIKRNFQSIRSLNLKIFSTVSIIIVFVIPSLLIATVGFRFVSGQIGHFSSPLEIITKGTELRYQRTVRKGGAMGSHILPPHIYTRLPWYVRWPVQTSGMIILPFPWLVTSVSKVFAMIDSIFVITLIAFFIKLRRRFLLKDEVLMNISYYTFILSIIVMGMIVINAGNAFRMRLAIAPYILIPAGIYFGVYLFNKFNKSKIDSYETI